MLLLEEAVVEPVETVVALDHLADQVVVVVMLLQVHRLIKVEVLLDKALTAVLAL